jgi:hypothetical protein
MAKPNSNERIAPSQITRSSLHYINLQFGGQRSEHSARQTKKPRWFKPGQDNVPNHL